MSRSKSSWEKALSVCLVNQIPLNLISSHIQGTRKKCREERIEETHILRRDILPLEVTNQVMNHVSVDLKLVCSRLLFLFSYWWGEYKAEKVFNITLMGNCRCLGVERVCLSVRIPYWLLFNTSLTLFSKHISSLSFGVVCGFKK